MRIPTKPLYLTPVQTRILQQLENGSAPIDQLVREMLANCDGREKDVIETLMRRQESLQQAS